MITGTVGEDYDAVIPLIVRSESGEQHEIEAVIDTGFNGFLTLPPPLIATLEGKRIGLGRAILADGEERLFSLYEVSVVWDGQPRIVEAEAADADPLVGMAMMRGYDVRIEVIPQGTVALQRLTSDEA